MLSFIRANAFGQLISSVEERLFSTHIPFHLPNEGSSLICHVAKGNPQWKSIEEQEVLVTFQGAHDYISPHWYVYPGVPTWNYQTVHIYGRAKLITEQEDLRSVVNELTEKHEALRAKPWKPEYKEAMLNGIVGIEIEIKELQGKYKLSQNRSEVDRKRVIEELSVSGSVALSEAMQNEL